MSLHPSRGSGSADDLMTAPSSHAFNPWEHPDAVAVALEPSALFSLFRRSYQLPPETMALATRDHAERSVYLPGSTLSENGAVQIMLVRQNPIPLEFRDLAASSADPYHCSVELTLGVSPVSDAADLASFRRTFLGRATHVHRGMIVHHFRPAVLQAISRCAEGRGVEVLIDPKNAEAFADEIAEELKPWAFSAGLKIELPLLIRFDSPVYRQVRQERIERQRRREQFTSRQRLDQAIRAADLRHAEHLAALLDRVRTTADEHPDADVPDLLDCFSGFEREEIYQALWATGESTLTTRFVVIGCGDELLFFDPASLSEPAQRVRLPGGIGAVRSVQVPCDAGSEQRLLIGAASGVHELALDDLASVTTYRLAHEPQSLRGGINAVVFAGEYLWATHSELGLLRWRRDAHAHAQEVHRDLTREARTVRSVQFSAGQLALAVDENVLIFPADQPEAPPKKRVGSSSVLTSLLLTPEGVYAGNADGKVLHWARDTQDGPHVLHTGRQRPVESLILLEAGGWRRLFFTDTSSAVSARVLGDAYTCRYQAGGQTLRRAKVNADLVVAANELRDRVFLWRLGQPAAPFGMIPAGQLTGHSVQDLALLTAG